MTAISLSFASVEHTLARGMGVLADDLPKFRARIKQLQRLGFPEGVNVGRGVRMPYELVHLIQLAVAFELLDCGLPAKFVTESVARGWDRISYGVWAAVSHRVGSTDRVYLACRFNAVKDVSGKVAKFSIEDHESLKDLGRRHGGLVIVNLTKVLGKVMAGANDQAAIRSFFTKRAVAEWYSSPPTYDFLDPENRWYRLGQFDGGIGEKQSRELISRDSDTQA